MAVFEYKALEKSGKSVRGVIDADSGPFHRRYQPIVAVIFPPQYRGKQLHQRFAANRRTMIKPRTVMADAHVDIAAELLTVFVAPLRCGGAGAEIIKGAADRGLRIQHAL